MDPYLESPVQWRGFHGLLIASLTAELNQQLPPGFAANVEERVYLVRPERGLYPDIAVLQRSPIGANSPVVPSAGSGGGGLATLAPVAAPTIVEDAPALLSLYRTGCASGSSRCVPLAATQRTSGS
jgi:hypothetical protein